MQQSQVHKVTSLYLSLCETLAKSQRKSCYSVRGCACVYGVCACVCAYVRVPWCPCPCAAPGRGVNSTEQLLVGIVLRVHVRVRVVARVHVLVLAGVLVHILVLVAVVVVVLVLDVLVALLVSLHLALERHWVLNVSRIAVIILSFPKQFSPKTPC